jgi:hypothetical protein
MDNFTELQHQWAELGLSNRSTVARNIKRYVRMIPEHPGF